MKLSNKQNEFLKAYNIKTGIDTHGRRWFSKSDKSKSIIMKQWKKDSNRFKMVYQEAGCPPEQWFSKNSAKEAIVGILGYFDLIAD